ncbi:MAG: alkaline phosphatase D family protein [Betaproteobacteria bacterium]
MVTRRRLLQATAALPMAHYLTGHAANRPHLTAAPVAGHFTHEGVRLWLQASDAAVATIAYWPETEQESRARRIDIALPDDSACSAIARIGDLTPGTHYRYRVLLDGQASGVTHGFRTAPVPGEAPGAFRLYMGSCAYTEALSPNGNPYGDEFHIFDTIAGKMQSDHLPHFMLWLGDNLYLRPRGRFLAEADFSSVSRMAARYRDVREKDMFQKLFAATHHYAIWDDHDYGPDNADKSFRFKADALRLFRQYWPNPDMGSPGLSATWTSFTHQDAEFFLLDDRTYRDDEKAAPGSDKAMFGPLQLAWLKTSLARSKATFKLVCNGSQLLSEDENGHHSGWHSYRSEREDFLAWLVKARIRGLLFLSGDRHNTQVFRLKQDGAPVVYEYSSSPFTSRLSKLSKKDRANPRFVAALGVEQRNFGTLEFTGRDAARRIIASCFDSNGKQLWQRTLASATTDAGGEPV